MYTYTLNIGLENNTLTAYQIEELINYNINTNGRTYYKQTSGEYNGNKERTLIVVIAGTTLDRDQIKLFIQLLCTILTQECIPVKGDGNFRELIYNSNFTGEKYNFDPAYFIEYGYVLTGVTNEARDNEWLTYEKQGVYEVLDNLILDMVSDNDISTPEMLQKISMHALHLRETDF